MGPKATNRLFIALLLALVTFSIQLIGSFVAGSLALLADSIHLLGDAGGLLLALFAATVARRAPTSKRTFGLQRAEILAAALNALVLLVASVWILTSAVSRIGASSEAVDARAMLIFGLVGLLANAIALRVLHPEVARSANVKGAFLHVLADFAGSVTVVVSALAAGIWPTLPFDSIGAVVIALLIAPQAWNLLRETTDILLEATPRNVNMDEVRSHIEGVEGVVGVHDLHAWVIRSGKPVLSAHVVVDDEANHGAILDKLGECLVGHFDIRHCTFQLESREHQQHELAMEEF